MGCGNMQKCRLNGEAVYAFKVMDENDVVNVEYEKMLRRASEQGELKCEDCGADIVFKFGDVKIPHFSHKNVLVGGGCSYSKESEEHIKGKKLLFDLMIKDYPDIKAEMRCRFSNGKWADLYFEFNDGQKLAIEFQRKLNSISYWEDKRKFYKSINVKDLWIASGKRDQFENILREYEFMFQHRLFLNDNSNKLLVLDVERKEFLIASKIIVSDKETNKIIMDKIFWRIYSLNDIKILPNGDIECEFDKEFKYEVDIFVQAYLEEKHRAEVKQELRRKEVEERNRKRIEEQQRRYNEEHERLSQFTDQAKNNYEKINDFSKGGYGRKNYSWNGYKKKTNSSYSIYNRKNDDYYKDKVNKAILGHRYGMDNLVRILVNGGSTEYNTIKKMFEEKINKGDVRAGRVFKEVMRLAGLD